MSTATLWSKHRGLARRIAAEYTFPGADRDDVEQEALIGLWEAARDYEPSRGSFPTYAGIVINCRLIDCLKAARASKRQLLTEAVRAADEDEAVAVLPHLHQVSDRAEERDDVRRLLVAIHALPDRQRYLILGVASGLSYMQMGGNLKQNDNLLYKARCTLRQALAA